MKSSIVTLSLFFFSIAQATIRLPAVINDNMVLQQKTNAKLWGWSDPGEMIYITTSWNNRVDSMRANGNGKWLIAIPTPSAGGPYTITIKGGNTIVLKNVLIGEVWICSGQSNMEMNYYWGLPDMKSDIPKANNPNIRFFQVPRTTAAYPQENLTASWVPCDSNTVKSFSAVAYYYGKKLNEVLNVPIGLIHSSWGGTPAEAWTPAELVNEDKALLSAAQQLTPSDGFPTTPGLTYNAMIAPLTNYDIAGAIWYQGETNTGTAATYSQLFATMINAWRTQWNKELPFYFVQIAPFAYGNRNIAALLREQQVKTLYVPKTGMVVTNDIGGDTLDIHPKDKRTVGFRLANLALANTYIQSISGASSPLYKSMQVTGNKIILSFTDAGSALKQTGKTIMGFSIAGQDKNFYPAEAKIAGNTIVVQNKMVTNPVAVRYAFSNTATGNVINEQGLPLSPFRTDNWPVDTGSVK